MADILSRTQCDRTELIYMDDDTMNQVREID